ncbi:MAG: tRNA (guanosine(37)-N1)-methyltransferase TrmD [Patescibacteria group bacterium]
MKRFDVITIFPEVIAPYAEASILGKAQKKKLLKIEGHDLRQYSKDKHKKVDDTPYGGGAGMVMTVQPFEAAVHAVKQRDGSATRLYRAVRGVKRKGARVILTSASGKRFTQADAKRLAEYDQVIFLCGRYEGVDHRVQEAIADEALSIGDYVLTGGELPALVMIDAIARNIPGVLGNAETLTEESHGADGELEYPQYTKPESYKFKNRKTLAVPPVLLSGNHKDIEKWRKEQMRSKEM